MNPVIQVTDLSYHYPGQPQEALSGITFSVKEGDFVGIIGPNGSGKTTLIKLLLGIIKQSTGAIELFGQASSQFKDRHRIGYVPQRAGTFDPNFPGSVFEIVRMGLAAKRGLLHHHTHDDTRDVNEALSRVEMLDFADRKISQLSGGQQQRVLIARALAAKSEILILDEPTAEVDIDAQRKFYDLLQRLNKELQITVILVAHDIGLITRIVKNVVCLNKILLCYGPPAKLTKAIEKLFHEHHVVKHACTGHSCV